MYPSNPQSQGERALGDEYSNSSVNNSHSRSHELRENPSYLSNLSYIASREYSSDQSLSQYQPHIANVNQNHGENSGQAHPKPGSSRGSRRPSGKNRFQRGHSSSYQQYQGNSFQYNNSSRTVDVESLRSSLADNLQLTNEVESLNSNQPSATSSKSQSASYMNRRGKPPRFENGTQYRNSAQALGETSSGSHNYYENDPVLPNSQPVRQQNRVSNGMFSAQDNRRQRERPPPSNSNSNQSSYRSNTRSKFKEYEQKNWRSDSYKRAEAPKPENIVSEEANHATQRERLTSQLTSGVYECMVCCESVQPAQSIWNCSQCFHVFHLSCVRRWARCSQDESGHWRCPGCQSVNQAPASTYYCFCSKRKEPEWNRRDIPHSCGEVCGKPLGDGVDCVHACTLLCHPGPCPTCSAQTMRKCPCGKTSEIVKCGSSEILLCGDPCDQQLTCGLHRCTATCHTGACEPCPIVQQQICFCEQTSQELACSVDSLASEHFECGQRCQKQLACQHHLCDALCHQGPCGPCKFQVGTVLACPCGKLPLKQLYESKKNSAAAVQRKICTDPVPVCGQMCGRIQACGPVEKRHTCPIVCHEGACPPCKQSTILRCRCGRNEKKIACSKLADVTEVLCERRCNKKRQCGRHKCIDVCCIEAEHICPMVCARQLSCGRDRCEALCHTGNCKRCYRVSFDELTCHCGSQVTYPPVPCGTRPPECSKPCSRRRPCGHNPCHNCHPEETCPPCIVLCEKLCYGKHELRKNVPCHLTEVSCGKACAKALACGRHACQTSCHKGVCPSTCTQPCPVVRTECTHPCNVPCHEGPCPTVSCKEKVKVQCQCGQRTATVSCEEQQSAYKKMATGLLAAKMTALQSGECVDFKDLLGGGGSNGTAAKTKSLECNEECALVERNRRLALALQISNPNPKPGAPRYPDSLKDWAKKDARFTQMVHDKLFELVQLAKQTLGKMRSRSYSFDPMNRDKRQFIHEYSVFFGCESASYDEEPKRNVVATAYGETSFLPAVSVVDVARREMGQRKMPAPPSMKGAAPAVAFAPPQPQQVQQPKPSAVAWGTRTMSDVVKSTPITKPPVVDYFDFTS